MPSPIMLLAKKRAAAKKKTAGVKTARGRIAALIPAGTRKKPAGPRTARGRIAALRAGGGNAAGAIRKLRKKTRTRKPKTGGPRSTRTRKTTAGPRSPRVRKSRPAYALKKKAVRRRRTR